jgi:hypothetical protein
MALLAPQDASNGVDSVTMSAATGGGDTIAAGCRLGGWDLGVFLLCRNTDAATKTVTVAGHPARVVPATTGIAVIPVFTSSFGVVKAITYSAVTGLTVAAVRLALPT